MESTLLIAFWGLSIALVMTPGADWAYAIAAGMRDRALVPAVAGMLIGYLLITAVVAAGIGALVASVPTVLTVLTFAGAAYLIWLGIGAVRNPPMPKAGAEEGGSGVTWLLRGFVISGMNPKALLLFLALLPQFTSRDAEWPVAGQIAAMGMVQIVNCGIVYSIVGIGSKAILRSRPRAARHVGQFSGLAMICIAMFIVIEEIIVGGHA